MQSLPILQARLKTMCMRASNLILSLLVVCTTSVHAQDSSPATAAVNLDLARELVDQLSQEFGRDDYLLLEPLAQYADQLVATGSFDEAHTNLDKAAQIARLHDGLYAQSQFPFLLSKVKNYANRGDWLHARELMKHLHWLLARNENTIDASLIDYLLELSDLHLRGVAEDNFLQQGYHFRAALQPNRLAIVAGQHAWGRYDMRLPPILYKLVLQQYLQAQTVNIGGKASASLRRYSGSGHTRSRADSRENFYFLGLGYLNEIRTIYSNQDQPDPVAVALSEMYLADWQVIFSEPEAARLGYARSFSGLLQAGIDREDINNFFAYPVMLPVAEFLIDWEAAVAAAPINNSQATLSFQEWSPSLPFLRAPIDDYNDDTEIKNTSQGAIFSFSLTGLEKISLWNLGRYKTAVSTAQNLEVLRHSFTSAYDQEELQQQLLEIRFRPKLINGVPQSVNATLLYQTALAN